MRRIGGICVVLAAMFFCMSVDSADEVKKIPKQPNLMWEVKSGGTRYYLIPYDSVSPSGHLKIRKQIPGFMFFFVLVDNKRGKENVIFKYGSNDIGFVCFRKKGEKDTIRYGHKDLTNTFKDPSQASKISPELKAMFKNLNLKPGEKGWTLICFSENVPLDRLAAVFWSLPDEPMPQNVTKKAKRANPRLIKKFDIPYIK